VTYAYTTPGAAVCGPRGRPGRPVRGGTTRTPYASDDGSDLYVLWRTRRTRHSWFPLVEHDGRFENFDGQGVGVEFD
jgi:hypothetical protein